MQPQPWLYKAVQHVARTPQAYELQPPQPASASKHFTECDAHLARQLARGLGGEGGDEGVEGREGGDEGDGGREGGDSPRTLLIR